MTDTILTIFQALLIWKWKWKLLTHVQCFASPWTVQSLEFSQARILEWVAFPFSRGSSQPRDWTQVSCIAGRFFTSWATREAQLLSRLYSFTLHKILWGVCYYSHFTDEETETHRVEANSILNSTQLILKMNLGFEQGLSNHKDFFLS